MKADNDILLYPVPISHLSSLRTIKKTELQGSVTSETNYTGLGHTSQIKGIVLHSTGFTIDIGHSS